MSTKWNKALISGFIALTISLMTFTTSAETFRNTERYNLENGVSLKGFDPVSYFPEGGSNPQEGSEEFALEYKGVVYNFASQSNQDQFLSNPSRYEPTYGGWCAYAMASGAQVDIRPQFFSINGNRLHFFVSSRAKRNFDREVEDHENRADQFWKQISGEEPRN
ncbi:MAG: YHS domain protein [Halobacteriovorax sp.]|nr:YHS domain protein [Halobacteriovorax sp.]|tara:strand:+ start:1818 stop:2309 length:492 start_codon:yes stop_codon:yes gene_type:complete